MECVWGRGRRALSGDAWRVDWPAEGEGTRSQAVRVVSARNLFLGDGAVH